MNGLEGFLLIFMILVVFIMIRSHHSVNSNKIIKQIEDLGGFRVEVQRRRVDRSGSFHYEVTFAGDEGKRYQTNCIVRGSKIFWTISPEELLQPPSPSVAEDLKETDETQSSKEEIINDLFLENQKLKEQIKRMGQESKDSGLGE